VLTKILLEDLSMRLPALLLLTGLLALGLPASGQVDFFFGSATVAPNTSTSYPTPYGNWYWGSRHQFLITAAELTAASVPAGGYVTHVAFNVTALNGAQPHQAFTVAIGHTTLTALTAWAPAPPIFTTIPSESPVIGWNAYANCVPFAWNGTDNIVIETCHQNTSYIANCSVATSSTATTSSRYFRQDAVGTCGNPAVTGTSFNRPDIRLTVDSVPLPQPYQSNQAPVASLVVNGVLGTGCAPALQSLASGSAVLSSNLAGLPWDFVISSNPLVPLGGGGIPLVDGQIINLDLSMAVLPLNGFFATNWPGLGFPGLGSSSLTLNYSGLPSMARVTTQAAFINPSSPSGLSLSAPSQIDVP
jgi:hypothetical protein